MQLESTSNTNTTASVIFSFSNGEETWRMQRMIKVYSYISSMYDSEEYFYLVTKMHDHEGELTVTVQEQSDDLEDIITKLWLLEGEPDVKIITAQPHVNSETQKH
tara:strand:+ start:296 stop:610 length:315 start_codon:yes stop_codon:yes gene_type:complete